MAGWSKDVIARQQLGNLDYQFPQCHYRGFEFDIFHQRVIKVPMLQRYLVHLHQTESDCPLFSPVQKELLLQHDLEAHVCF